MAIYTSHISASAAVTSSYFKGSTTSTGSFGRVEATTLSGDGSGITGLSSAAISSVAGMTNNYVLTATGADSVTGESNLTFDGTKLTTSGLAVDIGSSNYISIADEGTTGGITSTMNGVTIGGTTAAAGTFTTLASTGNTTIGDASGDSLTINAGSINVPSMGAGTSNSVVIKGGSSGALVTDEIDSRVWGSTLVDASGTPANNQLAVWTDANTVEGDSKVTWDGSIFAVDGNISANQYIVSSSVTYLTQSFSSGSTIFGDTLDDTHQFTGSLTVTGSVTATNFSGNLTGTLQTAAQSNITSVGTLGGLTVTVSDGGVDTTHARFDSNGGNIDSTTIGATTAASAKFTSVEASGNISGSSISTGSFGKIAGTLTTADQSNITGLGTLGSLVVNVGDSYDLITLGTTMNPAGIDGVRIGNNSAATGKFTTLEASGNISGSSISTGSFGHLMVGGGNFTSASLASSGGGSGVTISNNVNNRVVTGDGSNANAEANLTFDGTKLTTSGLAVDIGSSNYISIADEGTTGGITSTMNGVTIGGTTAAAGTFTTVTTSGNISGSSISTGSFGRVEATKIAGTLTTAAQSNITSVGTLGGLAVDIGSSNYITIEEGSSGNTATMNGVTIGATTAAAGTFTSLSTGAITPSQDNAYDLGSSARRFANLYVGDLMLSNKSRGGNEVDGTYGDYTIQEGEEDLFLLNNRSGKTYRFKLEEVEVKPWYKKIFS